MKLLTFLGIANYRETLYKWEGRGYRSRFSPLASCAFLEPEEIIVFLTADAERDIFPEFAREVPESVRVRPVPVPLGADEAELWHIFDLVAGCVSPGEEVAFDITNGLRSFPLLGLLAAAFLRSGLDVRLKAVLYGAFDVGRVLGNGETPMFDLTPMLALLEWSAAADRFNRTGDSRYLASLIAAQRNSLGKAAQGDPDLQNEAGQLGNLAGALTSISQSLQFIRPAETMESAEGLAERVEKARPALARSAAAQPFVMLLDSIQHTYSPLGMPSPLGQENIWLSLRKQREIIRWYAAREQWVQAVTLAREWVVNWFMAHLELRDITSSEDRARIEQVINTESRQYIAARQRKTAFNSLFLRGIPSLPEALRLWSRLGDVRNDINHAGMRPDPGRPKDLIETIARNLELLDSLPLEPSA